MLLASHHHLVLLLVVHDVSLVHLLLLVHHLLLTLKEGWRPENRAVLLRHHQWAVVVRVSLWLRKQVLANYWQGRRK